MAPHPEGHTHRAHGRLLEVRELSVSFATADGTVKAVDGVSFSVQRGEVLAIVGESGSGKSVTAMTLMGLTRGPNARIDGTAHLEGQELIGASEAELRRIRGARIAMVFQDPMSSLNPVHRVGDQIAEQISAHEPGTSRAQASERAVKLMERVEIPAARERARSYPHELSGGMRQRAMIAMALSLNPSVLLADEPTTALDVTVQAQIIEQLKQLRADTNAGIVLVTHDLGVVADVADRIAVMQAGRIVEEGTAEAVFYEPEHPHTRALLKAIESPLAARTGRKRGERLLDVENLEVSFRGGVEALSGVSLSLREGETLGVVGESGCGKTTLIRAIARLVEPAAGAIRFRGRDVTSARRRGLAALRSELGMVFQDSQASLNPRKRVRQTLASALRSRGVARKDAPERSRELLERVGLSSVHLTRFPHELSGGERQRVGIARALAGRPSLVVLDEPVSSLDASIRGQVIELLDELQGELGCGYVLVAHDLALMGRVADRIAVMYLGKIVELAGAGELYERPVHPYTQALLEAIPIPDPRASRARSRRVLGGEPPSPLAPPPGCRFHTRCPYATELCRTVQPPLVEHGQGRLAACHHPLDGQGREPSGIGVAPGERAE
jgi:peptide/nickel transport system ATP-binding protein